MTPTWIESVAYELAEKIQDQMEKAYNAGYDDGKGQAWSEEIKKYEIESEKVEEAELRGAESAWNLARHLFNVGEDPINNRFYRSRRDDKNKKALLEMPYVEAAEEYESWRHKKDEIHVGDEITFGQPDEYFKMVVLDESDEPGVWMVLTENGCVESFDERLLKKTGRHLDEIESILDAMRKKNAAE